MGTRRILVTRGNGKFLFGAGSKPDVGYATVSVDRVHMGMAPYTCAG